MFNNFQEISRLLEVNQQLNEQLTKSNLNKSSRVSVTSVERGDNVMVVWNEEHEYKNIFFMFSFDFALQIIGYFSNYVIYNETSNLFHFLHTNSLAQLGLTPSNGPRRMYATAEVVNKEFCQAR